MKIRYIRDWLNGNSSNGGNYWIKIQAYPPRSTAGEWPTSWASNRTSLTINTSVTSSSGLTYTGGASVTTLVDGTAADTSKYLSSVGSGAQWVQIDLGSDMDVGELWIWHYWADGRTFAHALQVASNTGYNSGSWITVQPWVWDKIESAAGRRWILSSITSGTIAAAIQGSPHGADVGTIAYKDFMHSFIHLVNGARTANNQSALSDGSAINIEDHNAKIEAADMNTLITGLNAVLGADTISQVTAQSTKIQQATMNSVFVRAWKTQQLLNYSSCNGGNCSAACITGCLTYCGSSSCGYGCGSGCAGACGVACSVACGSSCTSTCGDGCGGHCTSGCAETCSGSCANGCYTGCYSGCHGCSGACDWNGAELFARPCKASTCAGSCENSCEKNCGSACAQKCSSACVNYCQGTCYGDGCKAACMGGCGTDCKNGCFSACAGGCAYACYGFCQVSCSNTCIGTCSGSCASTSA